MCNTSLRVDKKSFGFHHISNETWRGIAWPHQNLKGKHYPIWGNLQTQRAKLFWFRLLEGYCSCPKLFNSHALPLSRYPIKPLGFITCILEFGRVLHNLSKT